MTRKKAAAKPASSSAAPSSSWRAVLAPAYATVRMLRVKKGFERLVYVVDVGAEADAVRAHLAEQGLPHDDAKGRVLFAVEIDEYDDTIVRDAGFAKLIETCGCIYEWYFHDAAGTVYTHDGESFISLRKKNVADVLP